MATFLPLPRGGSRSPLHCTSDSHVRSTLVQVLTSTSRQLCHQAQLFVREPVPSRSQHLRRERTARRRAIGAASTKNEPDRLDYRVRACGWSRSSDGSGVDLRLGDTSGATYSGLMHCGSIWACPTCTASIRHRRGLEIEQAAKTHMADGGGVGFLTLTVRHHKGHRLADLLTAVTDGWRSMTSGRFYQDLKRTYGIVGCIKTTEVTVGEENGWHPHLHLLVFLSAPLSDDARDRLVSELTGRWIAVLQRAGYDATARHGVRYQSVQWGSQGLGSYLAKVQDEHGYGRDLSSEMTRSDMKTGSRRSRTPFMVFDDWARTCNAGDLRLWLEYLRAIKGTRAIVWSHGLKARYAIGEWTDEQLADREVDDLPVLVRRLLPNDWQALCREDVRLDVLELTEYMHSAAVDPVVMLATLDLAIMDARCGVFRGTTAYLSHATGSQIL